MTTHLTKAKLEGAAARSLQKAICCESFPIGESTYDRRTKGMGRQVTTS